MLPTAVPVKLAVHVPPLSVQVAVVGDTPAPLAVKLALPVGVVAVPADVSVTVTVQVLALPNGTGLVQLTPVVVVRAFTVWLTLAEVLPLKLPSVA